MAVFIAGGKFMPLAYAKTPLAELLPVTLTNAEGRVVAEWRQGPFAFAVTGADYAHEIMELSASEAENVRIWESGCEWRRRLDGLTVKPGAEILAFAGGSSALKSPLLVVQHRGRGRVVFLASDDLAFWICLKLFINIFEVADSKIDFSVKLPYYRYNMN